MANTNTPFGMMPVENLTDVQGVSTHRYYIASGNGSAFYIGSPVVLTNTGDGNGVPGIAAAAATDTLVGAIVGIEPVNVNVVSMVGTSLQLEQVSIPATKTRDYYVYVADDPNQIFEIQCGATATNLVTTKLNNNASLTITAPSPTTLPTSATIVDNASINTTNTLNIRLMGLKQTPTNTVGAYQVMRCKINAHAYGNLIAGV